MQKREKLNTEPYAVTTDSEADIQKKITSVVKAFKIKSTKIDLNEVDELIKVPPFEKLVQKFSKNEKKVKSASVKSKKDGTQILISPDDSGHHEINKKHHLKSSQKKNASNDNKIDQMAGTVVAKKPKFSSTLGKMVSF